MFTTWVISKHGELVSNKIERLAWSRIGATLLEFGMSFPKSHAKMKVLFQWLAEHGEPIPPMLLLELRDHHDYYLKLNQLILAQERKLKEIVDHDERAQLLKTTPGVGTLTDSRCLSDISSAADFKNGRHLAAWLGASSVFNWRYTNITRYYQTSTTLADCVKTIDHFLV